MKSRHTLASGLATALFLICGSAFADVTFTAGGSNNSTGNVEAAQAVFNFNSTTDILTVMLTNTATAADIKTKFQPADILTAVFFGTTTITATPETAALTAGSTLIDANGSSAAGQPLGAEWAYADGFNGAQGHGLVNGISSTGIGIFGSGNFSCTTCEHLDGQPYGIVPGSFPTSTGTNIQSPIERDSVTFTLKTGVGFNLSSINDVVFQYGTSLSEFSTAGTITTSEVTPEPSYLLLVVPCLAVFVFQRVRRARRSAEA